MRRSLSPISSSFPAGGSRRSIAIAGSPTLDDGTEVTYDVFLGVPKHRAPEVVLDSGMAVDDYIPVDKATLATRYPGVYAIGDCATVGVPKAGAFAEGAARAVAAQLIAAVRGDPPPEPYRGTGNCYVEFGGGRVGAVRVDAGADATERDLRRAVGGTRRREA